MVHLRFCFLVLFFEKTVLNMRFAFLTRWIPLGSLLARFRSLLVPFGSLLVPVWIPLGSPSLPLAAFWLALGSLSFLPLGHIGAMLVLTVILASVTLEHFLPFDTSEQIPL